jgi:RNA polymerase sigma-70 factor (ECF subfamily)
MTLDDHLFRRESGRMVAALTRVFGVHNLALAEDVVQEAFVRALETWKARGMPDNPAAWLVQTAKNRAIDVVRRQRTARSFAPELARWLDTEWTLAPVIDEAFAPHAIRDEQLRMMFSCCEPRLPEEVQVALVLNILCGFSASEIGAAFLTGTAAIEKRISRGKKQLATSTALFDLGDAAFAARLSTVHRAVYLLFNEGYHGASASRVELCDEAIRLVELLCEHPPCATPSTRALASLMYLHAARLAARIDDSGELRALVDQDRSRWDAGLAAKGLELLEASAEGTELSAYHIEAAIAAVHAGATSVADTDWVQIAALYDRLAVVAPSPVVELNRAIAIGQAHGPQAGLDALHAIADRERLASYPFYPAAIGELELQLGHRGAARTHFEAAIAVARNHAERHFLVKRVHACGA